MESLLDMVDNGNINEAENYLYDLVSDRDIDSLKIALLFYSYLNDKSDEFLQINGFSREEIKLGIQNSADKFGLKIPFIDTWT